MDPRLKEAARRIIVPLDYPNLAQAVVTAVTLRNLITEYKIGLEAITAGYAHTLALMLYELGLEVGWDGKWSDIPNTITGAANALIRHGFAKWCNVHASAGSKSIEAAAKVFNTIGTTKLYGVTVLTSIDEYECLSSFGDTPDQKVLQFAQMLNEKDAQGIICSPQELKFLKKYSQLQRMWKTTPGVRPHWASENDQKRVMSPFEAIVDGADHLVIGRPITHPPNDVGTPEKAVELIAKEMLAAIEIRKATGTWKED